MENNENLPEIEKAEVEKCKNEAWDFISIFTEKYLDMIDNNGEEIIKKFNDCQHTLLVYLYLDSQVCNGGFIQLIQNGYGGYVFDTPFSEHLKLWGAEKASEIVERAKIIYNKHKKELEEKKSLEEFFASYKKITEFEPLEDEYYKINDEETERIKKYIEAHLNNFAKIK